MGKIEKKMIHDVMITPLKRFPDERGTVMHIMKATDPGFNGFGEVYCSTVYPGMVKGWHCHNRVTLNYVVMSGMIKLVLFDERENSPSHGFIQEIFMGGLNYIRVTIPPGIWYGFKGVGIETAWVCNVINEPHDPSEAKRLNPHMNHIPYSWEREEG